MIEELRIRGLGVIEESVLELGPGFTAITGETGAGKTMVVTALGLLLGGRADVGAVRTGARAARVEGVVEVGDVPVVQTLIDEVGGELEDRRVVLARQVSVEGRSRAYAGGVGVPAAVLTRCAESLVAVHGQSDQHRLLRQAAQRDALDRFAGRTALELRAQVEATYAALRATEAELDDVVSRTRERAREADLLRFGLEEVARVAPVVGEERELAAEESRLAFADTLRLAAEGARSVLSADEGPDALGLVASGRRQLDGVRDHDPQAAGLADRLAELSYLLSDAAADVASYASGLDTDPARLAAVSERRAELAALTRKYGDTLEEVLAWSVSAASRLCELEDTDGRTGRLTATRERQLADLAGFGGRLSEVRRAAAAALAEAVTTELTALAMPHARVSIMVSPGAMGPTGSDEVEFRLSANLGSEPRALGKGASGGELSRVMLALEVALAGTTPVPTFVFDEVDAGVGGRAAVEVGRRLGMLARSAQVVVVTHLPQVAAFADRHVVVAKSADGLVTTSGLSMLDDQGRVRELSRMLAGLEDSATARAHAQELLESARTSGG